MKRFASIGVGLATVAVVLVVTNPFASTGYRVNAIFDTADGIHSGMNVEVAGVPVGRVTGVHLTRGPKAELELQVNRRFAPFHTDASCHILPEGLISENYVQCDPGSASAPALDGSVPTVPVTHTAAPVSLQQFIDIFSLPTSDRLSLLLNELGLATAGRGEDINGILDRANPALTQARRVLSDIDAQRAELTDAITQTGTVVAELAARRRSVRSFVDNAAQVSTVTALHRGPLGQAVARLPAFLTQVHVAAESLTKFSRAGAPLLAALRAGAPALTTLTGTVPQFVAAATPAVHKLTALAVAGRPALEQSEPVVAQLKRFVAGAQPASGLLQLLLANLQQRGGIEYLLDFGYTLGTGSAVYDGISHMIAMNQIVTQCVENPLAPGCNRGWGSTGSREQAGGESADSAPRRTIAPRSATSRGSSPTSRGSGAGRPRSMISAPSAVPTQPTSSANANLTALLDYLLK